MIIFANIYFKPKLASFTVWKIFKKQLWFFWNFYVTRGTKRSYKHVIRETWQRCSITF